MTVQNSKGLLITWFLHWQSMEVNLFVSSCSIRLVHTKVNSVAWPSRRVAPPVVTKAPEDLFSYHAPRSLATKFLQALTGYSQTSPITKDWSILPPNSAVRKLNVSRTSWMFSGDLTPRFLPQALISGKKLHGPPVSIFFIDKVRFSKRSRRLEVDHSIFLTSRYFLTVLEKTLLHKSSYRLQSSHLSWDCTQAILSLSFWVLTSFSCSERGGQNNEPAGWRTSSNHQLAAYVYHRALSVHHSDFISW